MMHKRNVRAAQVQHRRATEEECRRKHPRAQGTSRTATRSGRSGKRLQECSTAPSRRPWASGCSVNA